MQNKPKTKKQRLTNDFPLSLNGDWGGHIMDKDDDKQCKFQTDKVTDLAYDMLCNRTCLDNEEKDGYNIIGNPLIKLKILTTNIQKLLVCQQCEQEKALKIKLEEEYSFIILILTMI